MGSPENVDSRASDGLLWQASGSTFSITYSIVKNVQTRIVEPYGVSRLFAVWSNWLIPPTATIIKENFPETVKTLEILNPCVL